jgi:hypothetical protein
LQLAHVTEITFANGPQGGRIYGCDRNRIASEGHELDFVSRACVMNVNDRTNVSCLELFTRQVRRQYNRIMFFDRHARKVSPLVRSRQRPHAEDFILAQRFQSGFRDRCHSDGVAKGIEHFDRIASLAIWRRMMIDDLYDVTAAKAVFGNIASKSSVSIKFEAHDELFFGN